MNELLQTHVLIIVPDIKHFGKNPRSDWGPNLLKLKTTNAPFVRSPYKNKVQDNIKLNKYLSMLLMK